MTLVLNEIHLLSGLNKTLLVAAADRRVSKPDGTYDSTRKKLFPIHQLNGAISYFGIAEVFPNGKPQYLSEWLPSFIRQQASSHNLRNFSENLRDELNRIVPSSVLHNRPSGFHICGYDDRGYPDFWYISNIGGIRNFKYINLQPQYSPAESHFLERDALTLAGWNGKDPLTANNDVYFYRNGDYRAHVAAWKLLDDIFKQLTQYPDFIQPKDPQSYREYVKFKFEFIAYLYKNWAKKKIIARPIDVLVFQRPVP